MGIYSSTAKIVRRIASTTREILSRCIFIIKYSVKPSLLFEETYYPEEKQKSKRRIYWEQISNILRYGEINSFYYLYGLDVKSKDECNEYTLYKPFMKKRDILNAKYPYSKGILRDKLYFGIVAEFLNIKTPKNVAYIMSADEAIILETKEILAPIEMLNTLLGTYFCKILDGECGDGVFKLEVRNGKFFINDEDSTQDQVIGRLKNGSYLIQKQATQHPEMNRLYPNSINTIRLITIKNPETGDIDYFPSMLRVGAHGSIVDNTSKGGFAVGFDENTGRLKKYGLHKPQYGRRITEHPDTKVVLESFTIPYIKEAISQAKSFHKFLGLHSVGWDIAIGPDRPIFIEGNDNWEINGPQSVNGGLKQRIEKYFGK